MAKAKATKSTAMQVELWDVERCKPYDKNPRKISDLAVEQLAKGIKRYGFRNPVLVDKEGVIIAGHTRLRAAMSIGYTQVPVIVHADMSESDAAALRIADNKLAELTEWDMGILIDELHLLEEIGIEIEELGFSAPEILQMFEGVGSSPDGGTDPRAEWKGMPEFDQEDKRAFKSFVIHFHDQAGVDKFSKLIGQPITPNTRFVWYPYPEIESYVDKVYDDAEV
jgi:ParB/RepB/Spo0J family partition protein